MSHWAEINKDNKVIRILVGDNDDPNGDEGYKWLVNNLGGTWIKTSYNSNFRKHYAGIGYLYDPLNDWFQSPQPYPSWTLDQNANWQPPQPYPNDYHSYTWNEEKQEWVLIKDE